MIRPTPTGVSLCSVGLLAGIGGFLLGYPEAVALGLLFVALLVLGLVLVLGPASLSVSRALSPPRAERGAEAKAQLRVARVDGSVSASIVLEDMLGDQLISLRPSVLAGGKDHVLEYDLPTDRRGVMSVGPLRIERRDALGLWSRRSTLLPAVSFTVWPRVFAVSAPRGGRPDDVDTTASLRALEGSGSFRGIREYVPGDDLRKVHWRSTARLRRLMVRQYVDVEKAEVVVILDDRLDAYDSDARAEEAMDLAASLLLSGAADVVTRLATVSGRLQLTRVGTRDRAEALDALARLPFVARTPDNSDSARPISLPPVDPRSTAVLITGHHLEGRPIGPLFIEGLRRRFTRVTIFALGPSSTHGESSRSDQISGPDAPSVLRQWSEVTQ